jgi:hypothetical protein
LQVERRLAQFGQTREIARRRYKEFMEQGIVQQNLWSELKRHIYLGDERFVEPMQARLVDTQANDVNIPIPKARWCGAAPTLNLIETRYGDRSRAIMAAHDTGEYSYQQIGKYFGMHFTTVGRIVRAARKVRGNSPA